MSAPYRQRFRTGSLFIACLVCSPLLVPAQEGATSPKPATPKAAKKRVKAKPTTEENTSPVTNPADLPLGVQDNLAEARRLQEQYRREEAARRRAEAEARKKGLPWPPPEETSPEQPATPSPSIAPQTVSQPAPPPEEETPPPPTTPPVEQQMTTPQPESQSGNGAQDAKPAPPALPAGGKTIIRTWPQVRKTTKPSPPQ
jgi:hypothetical protein